MMDYSFDNFEVNESRITLNKDEEIKKLTLEEDLPEIKRAQIILMKGQQRQKLAIYNNLHRLLSLGFDQLYQYIRGDIMEQSEEVQIIAARSLQGCKIKPKEIIQLSLHFIQLYQWKLAQAWMPVFQNLVLLIDYKEFQTYLEKMILQFSEPKQPEIGRWVGAKMIVCISPVLKDEMKGPILDRARLLCSDPDHEIRELVADELLTCLICNLSGELVEQYFIDKINELLYDTQINVKKSMIKTFLRFQHKFPRNSYNIKGTTIFIDCLSTNNIELLSVALQYCGETFVQIQDQINDEFKNKFTNLYQKFGQHQNDDIRKWYLYNLPGIIQHLHEGPYASQILMPYADILIQDKSHQNKLLACKILHEISKQFDYSYVLQKMWHLFECVIQSEDLDCILVINLPEMYKLLQGNEENQEKLKTQFKDINQQLQKVYQKCLSNYQYNQIFLEHLLKFLHLINKKHFEQYILPVIYKDQQNIDSDILSMKCLAKFYSVCQDYEIQMKIKDTMNLMFFRGNNNKRVRYIFWVSNLVPLISKKRFQELNLNQILSYSSDKAASVQIQLIKSLPKIYQYLEPIEYNLIKNVKGITQQSLARDAFLLIQQRQQQNQNFQEEQNILIQQEEAVFTQFTQQQKQEKGNDLIQNNEYANKYLKKPFPKLIQSQSKKTPNASTSVRLANQSFGELTPQQLQQQQQFKRVRRYTDAAKSTSKPSSRPSGFTQK
ncbi:unnamed protein product [Paramecium primaurelia]|uniref:Uncharacterized protein n=1 Tax=Paramecium primaurelia TaxID=5886 RepID=A0A8S1NJA8_PARPR|nr:unnamed protein product [Paramecium primaurelia]